MKEKITYIVKWLARRLITPCCRVFLLFYIFTFVSLPASAQKFFNLTADEVKVDSLLPVFSHSFALGDRYADSVYTVSIDYPEFIDMSQADVARYQHITTDELPAMPKVETFIGTSRRKGTLYASLVPLVFRNGKFQKLVSFKLTVHAQPATKPTHTTGLPLSQRPRNAMPHTPCWPTARGQRSEYQKLVSITCRMPSSDRLVSQILPE